MAASLYHDTKNIFFGPLCLNYGVRVHKTAIFDYDDHEAALADQLTAYALAEPEAKQLALCVFVKTKEPRIEWHFAKGSAGDLAEYLDKVRMVSEDIAAGRFYKRPGKHCAWC